jgi:hypothetical protein
MGSPCCSCLCLLLRLMAASLDSGVLGRGLLTVVIGTLSGGLKAYTLLPVCRCCADGKMLAALLWAVVATV